MIRHLVGGLLVLFSGSLFAQGLWQEGVHYKDLAPKQVQVKTEHPIQVEYWFWYGCASCTVLNELLPQLKTPELQWQTYPAQLRANWYFHAKAYHFASHQPNAAELELGLFQTLNNDSKLLSDQDSVIEWFEKQGFSHDTVKDKLRSPLLNAQLKQELAQQQKWQIRGVPALIIDQRYLVDAGMVHSVEEFVEVTQFLLQQARQNRAKFSESEQQ